MPRKSGIPFSAREARVETVNSSRLGWRTFKELAVEKVGGGSCAWQPLGTNRLVLKQAKEVTAELYHTMGQW